MTLKVVFRRAARAEFDDAAVWYEERQHGLGMQFTSEIDRSVELAAMHPERFPIVAAPGWARMLSQGPSDLPFRE